MKKMRLSLLAAAVLVALAPVGYAIGNLGGSAFPLTFITQSPINLTDSYNQLLQTINAQTVGISTVYSGAAAIPPGGVDVSPTLFSSSIQGNPLMQNHYDDATLAQLNSVKTVITGATGRTIYPGNIIVMASGTAAGATSIVLKCSVSATALGTWPIATLVTNVPVTAFSSGVTPGKALAQGCSSGEGILASVVGSALTTTTDLYINLPYTVQ